MDAELRTLVWQRAGDRCEYCRLHQEHVPLTLQIERNGNLMFIAFELE